MQQVAVIGATGFFGRRLVPALAGEGYRVTMIARRRPDVIPAGSLFRSCDATDPARLLDLLRDAGDVVNAISGAPAGIVSAAAALRDLCLAGDAPRRIVHISSLAVFGRRRGVLDEETRPDPPRLHRYAVAKWQAERYLLAEPRVARRCVILRPGCLYGTGAPIWSDRIGRLLLDGRLGWLGRAGSGWCNLLHVDDLARGVVRALQAPDTIAGIHHVVSPEELTWNRYFGLFATQLGLPPLAPMGAARLAAETWWVAPAAHLRHRVLGHEADYLTPSMLRVFRNRALALTRHTALGVPQDFRPLHDALPDIAAGVLKQRQDPPRASFAKPAWASLS